MNTSNPAIDTKLNYVELIIDESDDPTPWEGCINGKFYRIEKGVSVKVPLVLAKLIESNSRVTMLSERLIADYKASGSKNGKCLSERKQKRSD